MNIKNMIKPLTMCKLSNGLEYTVSLTAHKPNPSKSLKKAMQYPVKLLIEQKSISPDINWAGVFLDEFDCGDGNYIQLELVATFLTDSDEESSGETIH